MDLSTVLEKELLAGRFWTHSRTLVSGCTKVSPGCSNCWSEAMQMRFTGGKPFDGTVVEHWDRMLDILPKGNRARKPRVWSYWNDVFHEAVSENFLTRLFNLIDVSQDYHIICTKRPKRALEYLRRQAGNSKDANLIILVSMEDQDAIRERLPVAADLSDLGFTVGVLTEPLLQYVSFRWVGGSRWEDQGHSTEYDALKKMSWVVCGPENGKGKRPFAEQWAIAMQAEAQKARVPFFYKAGLLNGKQYIETP